MMFRNRSREDSDEEMILLYYIDEVLDRKQITCRFNMNSFTDAEFKAIFRFYKNDFNRLLNLLNLPQIIKLSNRIITNNMEMLLIVLRRLSYPNRLMDLESMFGRSSSEISRIFNVGIEFVYSKSKHLLEFGGSILTLQRLRYYSTCIHNAGSPYKNCIGFIDGTLRPICRPNHDQSMLYNGHKRVHGIKFQNVMAPDGIVLHMNGPWAGSRHDAGIFGRSNILDLLKEKLSYENETFCIYGDSAYPLSTYIQTPFKGTILSSDQALFNSVMSGCRITVEWSFAKIIQEFAFLDYKKNLKLNLQIVDKYYLVGTLFSNCHVCCYGSETSKFFKCDPPSLEDYLATIGE